MGEVEQLHAGKRLWRDECHEQLQSLFLWKCSELAV